NGLAAQVQMNDALDVLEQAEMLVGEWPGRLLVGHLQPLVVLGNLHHLAAELADAGDRLLAGLALLDLFDLVLGNRLGDSQANEQRYQRDHLVHENSLRSLEAILTARTDEM